MNAKEFPLLTQAENTFNKKNVVKKELEVASLNPIDEAMPFVLECDASESTISATMNQVGRPVVIMSRIIIIIIFKVRYPQNVQQTVHKNIYK